MTQREGDRPERSEHDRTTFDLSIVLVLFLVGTIALLAIFGP